MAGKKQKKVSVSASEYVCGVQNDDKITIFL